MRPKRYPWFQFKYYTRTLQNKLSTHAYKILRSRGNSFDRIHSPCWLVRWQSQSIGTLANYLLHTVIDSGFEVSGFWLLHVGLANIVARTGFSSDFKNWNRRRLAYKSFASLRFTGTNRQTMHQVRTVTSWRLTGFGGLDSSNNKSGGRFHSYSYLWILPYSDHILTLL